MSVMCDECLREKKPSLQIRTENKNTKLSLLKSESTAFSLYALWHCSEAKQEKTPSLQEWKVSSPDITQRNRVSPLERISYHKLAEILLFL